MLREHVESELAANTDVDPEFTKALEENTVVMYVFVYFFATSAFINSFGSTVDHRRSGLEF